MLAACKAASHKSYHTTISFFQLLSCASSDSCKATTASCLPSSKANAGTGHMAPNSGKVCCTSARCTHYFESLGLCVNIHACMDMAAALLCAASVQAPPLTSALLMLLDWMQQPSLCACWCCAVVAYWEGPACEPDGGWSLQTRNTIVSRQQGSCSVFEKS